MNQGLSYAPFTYVMFPHITLAPDSPIPCDQGLLRPGTPDAWAMLRGTTPTPSEHALLMSGLGLGGSLSNLGHGLGGPSSGLGLDSTAAAASWFLMGRSTPLPSIPSTIPPPASETSVVPTDVAVPASEANPTALAASETEVANASEPALNKADNIQPPPASQGGLDGDPRQRADTSSGSPSAAGTSAAAAATAGDSGLGKDHHQASNGFSAAAGMSLRGASTSPAPGGPFSIPGGGSSGLLVRPVAARAGSKVPSQVRTT